MWGGGGMGSFMFMGGGGGGSRAKEGHDESCPYKRRRECDKSGTMRWLLR